MDFLNGHQTKVDIGKPTITLQGITCPVKEQTQARRWYAIKQDVTVPEYDKVEVAVHHSWHIREQLGHFVPIVTLGELMILSSQLMQDDTQDSLVWVENQSSDNRS